MPSPFTQRAAVFAAGLIMLAAAGCESLQYRPRAAGQESEILVVVDSTSWNGALGDVLREELAPWVGTLPAPEPLFDLRQISLRTQSGLESVQKMKNIVFAAPIGDESSEARFLRNRLDSAAVVAVMERGETAVVSRRDLWRTEQQVYYVVGATAQDVAVALRENGEDIRYAFNAVTRERMTRTMFDRGRQPEIEDSLAVRHGFAVNAQHDYWVAIDTTDFVWLRRQVSPDSWRSLFVAYTDTLSPAELSPEWAIAARDRLTKKWIEGTLGDYVRIDDRRPLESENISFLNRFGYEIRGLWHMVGDGPDGRMLEFGMGGPFVTYAFYDQPTGRTYVIDGMVFAPGFEKREFLRQVEVIAYTFRSAAELEEESDEGAAAAPASE